MRISEYLNATGVVFAVAWAGPVQPDMRQILGSHYADYTAASPPLNHPGLHRSARIDANPGWWWKLGGHMRAYCGSRVFAALMPANVAAAELR